MVTAPLGTVTNSYDLTPQQQNYSLHYERFYSGTEGADTFTLTSHQVEASGLGGDDLIVGNALDNRISGGSGNDALLGGGGADGLEGGAGRDRFDYNGLGEAGDTIVDFTTGDGGDVLDLHDLLEALGSSHDGNAFTGGYLRFQQSGADTLVQIDADGGGDGFVTLATLQNALLTQADTANYVL